MKPSKHLRVVTGEDERYGKQPLFKAIVLAAREYGLAEAVAYKGFMGSSPTSGMSYAGILAMAENLPIVVHLVGDEECVRDFLPFLLGAVPDGSITCSDIEAERIFTQGERG